MRCAIRAGQLSRSFIGLAPEPFAWLAGPSFSGIGGPKLEFPGPVELRSDWSFSSPCADIRIDRISRQRYTIQQRTIPMSTRPTNANRIGALRRQIAQLEGTRRHGDCTPISSGCGPLDQLLPESGFRRGTLIEWLAEGEATGVETLAMAAAVQACRRGRALVVLDRRHEFDPPAAARLGIELQNLIVVHTGNRADDHWALDQALRCSGVAAVLAWPEQLDGRTFRRLQLAAEVGGGLGLLVRPLTVRREPSWADVRLLVEPLPAEVPDSCNRRLRVRLLRCRGVANGRSVEVEIDNETHGVYLAARLAEPAARCHAAGV